MHCMSTTIASIAPVARNSSVCVSCPAYGTPYRITSSFPMQQIPTTLIRSAPASFASFSSRSAHSATLEARIGLWPWQAMLTCPSLTTE